MVTTRSYKDTTGKTQTYTVGGSSAKKATTPTAPSTSSGSSSTPKPYGDLAKLQQIAGTSDEQTMAAYNKVTGGKDGVAPPTPITPKPITPVPTTPITPTAPTQPISDTQVQDLGTQGFTEGANVPGKGILGPDGTFSQPTATDLATTYRNVGANPPTGVDVTDPATASQAVTTAVTGATGTPDR